MKDLELAVGVTIIIVCLMVLTVTLKALYRDIENFLGKMYTKLARNRN